MSRVRNATFFLACACALIGSFCFILTGELACVIPIAVGLLQGLLAFLIARYGMPVAIASLVLSTLVMIVTAQTVPRLIHTLVANSHSLTGSVTAFALLSVMSLTHLTLGIRWLVASRH